MGFVESTGFVLFVFFALRLAWAFLKFLRVTLLPEFFGFAVDLKRYGEWAGKLYPLLVLSHFGPYQVQKIPNGNDLRLKFNIGQKSRSNKYFI